MLAACVFAVGLIAQNRAQVIPFMDDAFLRTRLIWLNMTLSAKTRALARLETLEKARVMQPGSVLVHQELGDTYLDLGYLNRAEGAYQVVLKALSKKDPAAMPALLGLAKVHREQLHWQRAHGFAADAFKLNRNSAPVLTELGDVYLDASFHLVAPKQRWQQWRYTRRKAFRLAWAGYYYQKSLQIRPRQFRTRFQLGYVRLEQKRPEAAASQFCRVLTLDSPQAKQVASRYKAWYNLGLAFLQGGFGEAGMRALAHSAELLDETQDMAASQQMRIAIQGLRQHYGLSTVAKAGSAPEATLEQVMIAWPALKTLDCLSALQPDAQPHSKGSE